MVVSWRHETNTTATEREREISDINNSDRVVTKMWWPQSGLKL